MKNFLTVLLLSITTIAFAQQKGATPGIDKNKKILRVEASCGQCQFGLPGKSCDLAVRMNGKAYFVDGSNIDSHGDAHASDGFCNAIRRADVQGEIVNGRFKSSYFKVLPPERKKETSKPASGKI